MKLYEKQSYLKENETRVTACEQVDGKWMIQLEETVFFPEEGGQYADTGCMMAGDQKILVLDGQLKQGEIWYQVDQEVAPGTAVACSLDWGTRYMRMQQHTGEHILTGVIHNHFGYNNVGFHLSDDAPITLDLDGMLTPEQIGEMELVANEVVYSNLPVVDSYPSREDLLCIDYRSKIEIEGQVRLITIGQGSQLVDVCACCAPHVARTGEVGLIKVVSYQKYKGGIRLNVLCGKRALQYFQAQNAIMNQLSRTFSTTMDKVPACVENQMQEISQLKYKFAEYAEKGIMDQIQQMPEAANGVLFVSGDISAVTMKNCYNAMTAKFPGYAGVFAGDDESGYRYNAGSIALDARELMNQMKEKLGARGGGSADMVQGKMAMKKAEIQAFFAAL